MKHRSGGLSGQQLGRSNVQKFEGWVAERDAAGDWHDYVRRGKLNRSEIAAECGFARSVFGSNPDLKVALDTLDRRLCDQGLIADGNIVVGASGDAAEASMQAADRRVMAARAKAEARVKALEEQNAALKAEIRDLRDQLSRFKHLDDHLGRTGRLLQL
ncbi:MAG: hypothetical protein AzoDbin1_01834 [Azoarcus sp.]|nr:hypothetical protein [Azoarcus sp.]